MQQLTAAQIRQAYLEFFQRHGHAIVPSSSLVVADDPTLLFTNAGMVQFKNLFLGQEQRAYNRATTAQKCLRVSGKHNDLEEVGASPRHHTFFEMLGNFSFGDYFKAEAIQMAWDLLTKDLGLPVERLWFTVFQGNEQVPADEEAADLWQQAGAAPERILRFSEKDNFWVMADTGPCGPCSEITIYIGDDLDTMHPGGVNSDDPDYVEIWNLVFMQFERSTMQPLPRPSVDTGMGLERMAMVMQQVHSTYETDLFTPIITRTRELLGRDEAHYRANLAPYRAVADHSRAIAFLIADGVLPGNSGRSYVLRRILRRAAYQGRILGIERPFLAEVVDTVIGEMGGAYPELRQRRNFILEMTDSEEQQFLRTLSGGLSKLTTLIDQLKSRGEQVIPGNEAFRLKDTDGFPLDLTQKIASAHEMTIDESGFEAALEEQRERSRASARFQRDADAEIWGDRTLPETEFVGYTTLSCQGRVVALVVGSDDVGTAHQGQQVQVVLDTTPFYAESGGQVGDTGLLRGSQGQVRVEDTQRPVPGFIVHYGRIEEGSISHGELLMARVDALRRLDIQRNHTVTHLAHRILRDILGDHATQSGSLVAPQRMRFDFAHPRAVSQEQMHEIERRLNMWVRADSPVVWKTMSYQEALEMGATALFGEKYGDTVRVVQVARTRTNGDAENGDGSTNGKGGTEGEGSEDGVFASRDSIELCGGTHIVRTGEIGLVRLVNESSIGSGLRRIEVLTGRGAEAWVDEHMATLNELATSLDVPISHLSERVKTLLAEHKQRLNELEKLQAQTVRYELEHLPDQVRHEQGVPLLVSRVRANDASRLREMGDWLRDKLGSAIIVLGAIIEARPHLLAMITPDLVKQGYHAGNLIKSLAPIVGGGGGGRADMAQAGGREPEKLDTALARVSALIAEHNQTG
jgi:alanyl-tRNA synthetase